MPCTAILSWIWWNIKVSYGDVFSCNIELSSSGISSLIFPTAWENAPPLLSAVGYHSSLARGKQINFLSANRNYPVKNQTGSGIYSSTGVLASWTSPDVPATHLVTARVPVRPSKYEVDWAQFAREEGDNIPAKEETFQTQIFFDNFTAVSGSQLKSGINKVCQGSFCCLLNMSEPLSTKDLIFGAFSGLHEVAGRYYMEICLVTGAPGPQLWHLSLAGTFSTQHVYPQALYTQDLHPGEREVSADGVFTVSTQAHTVGIIGRNYQMDGGELAKIREDVGL